MEEVKSIQQQIVSEYLCKEVTHEEALKVIESDFGGLIVFVGNLKEFRKAQSLALKQQEIKFKLGSRYRHGAFLQN